MLWPHEHDDEVVFGHANRALDQIKGTQTKKPTTEEMLQARYLLRASRSGRMESWKVAQSICTAALTWRDLALWKEAVEVCRGDRRVSILGLGGLRDAVINLGLSNVKEV